MDLKSFHRATSKSQKIKVDQVIMELPNLDPLLNRLTMPTMGIEDIFVKDKKIVHT